MDDPVQEITPIVHLLTQGTPQQQKETINKYFTPDASFTHPFCRTGSFDGSRVLIHAIFQWYKVLSPKIELEVKSIAYDEKNLLLYLTIHQIFAVWFIPFYRAPVTLTTVLTLVRRRPTAPSRTHSHGGHDHTPNKLYIAAQNDLYQVDQFIKFVMPWGVGLGLVMVWHYFATMMCVVGAFCGRPVTRWRQRRDEAVERRRDGTGDVEMVDGSKGEKER